MAEVEQVTSEVGFQHVAAYDNFSFEAATSNSERIHWVVRRPSLAE
jgi:hypothetical protein